jgi:hypothetical protein
MRPSRINAALLRARVPSDEELAKSEELLQICIRRSDENAEDDDDDEAWDGAGFGSFEELRSSFLKQNQSELDGAGMDALMPAPIAPHIKSRFLSTCNEHGKESLVMGYHGTPARNHNSIFQSGLMIPGNGSVRIANGNAHGRGIYIAEKGAHNLSMGFLRGDPHLLVCGVVDNTLAPAKEDQRAVPSPSENKKLRFLFHGASLAHRCHRRPWNAKDNQSKQQQQQYVGCQPLYAETHEVRHAGNAMVIRDEQHVAPLFIASIRGSAPYGIHNIGPGQGPHIVVEPDPNPNVNRIGQVEFSACHQVMDPRDDEHHWLTPEGSTCRHGRNVKRRFEKKLWHLERRGMREEKYAM